MTKGEIFSQRFIPSLLDGTKVRTSRPIKAPVLATTSPPEIVMFSGGVCTFKWDGSHGTIGGFIIKPKYRPGDIMYVRETWRPAVDGETGIALGGYFYKADGGVGAIFKDPYNPWRPSIHMPREAARIFLRVTDVKVQHIDTMTEQDAVEDGFEPSDGIWSALDNFKHFWLKAYGSDAQWMWVYYFERISREEAGNER